MIRHAIWMISFLFLAILACLNSACVATHSPNNDPFETYNRTVFGFNMAIDKVIMRPMAKAYDFIVPDPIEKCIGNFFSNIGQMTTIANDILQVNPRSAVRDSWYFAINSTVGILGLFDVASRWGLERNPQDFGLTLAKWGFKDSPYLVLPWFGPSTVYNSVAIPTDYYFLSAWPHINPTDTRYALYGMSILHLRKTYLNTDKLVDEAFDPYTFVRSAYLQSRAFLAGNNTNEPLSSPCKENSGVK